MRLTNASSASLASSHDFGLGSSGVDSLDGRLFGMVALDSTPLGVCLATLLSERVSGVFALSRFEAI